MKGALTRMPAEYRVVWQRAGTSKRHKIFQTESAAVRFCAVVRGNPPLPAEFRGRDLDEHWCCPGTREYECGCRGITVGDAIGEWRKRQQERYEGVPALAMGPEIEARNVGDWSSRALLERPDSEVGA